MYDDRLASFFTSDKRMLFPSVEALRIWESKRRTHYWLTANRIPHPKTWVFYDLKAAQAFAKDCALPIVFKSDMGSGSSGVLIFRNRKALFKHIVRCFSRGFTTTRRFMGDNEVGSVLLQEYLENAREWRCVRIGDSYFAFEKLKVNQFHSGSHQFSYGRPPDELLTFARHVSDCGAFKSMDMDLFITSDGTVLVNELQPLFGQAGSREISMVDGVSGRFEWSANHKQWVFEPGKYCQNFMCNLRVKYVLSVLQSDMDIAAKCDCASLVKEPFCSHESIQPEAGE
jgi:hypothetical protein